MVGASEPEEVAVGLRGAEVLHQPEGPPGIDDRIAGGLDNEGGRGNPGGFFSDEADEVEGASGGVEIEGAEGDEALDLGAAEGVGDGGAAAGNAAEDPANVQEVRLGPETVIPAMADGKQRGHQGEAIDRSIGGEVQGEGAAGREADDRDAIVLLSEAIEAGAGDLEPLLPGRSGHVRAWPLVAGVDWSLHGKAGSEEGGCERLGLVRTSPQAMQDEAGEGGVGRGGRGIV